MVSIRSYKREPVVVKVYKLQPIISSKGVESNDPWPHLLFVLLSSVWVQAAQLFLLTILS